MRVFYELLPAVQTLIDREGELLKGDVDVTDIDDYKALLQDVTAAGAEVPEGHDRDTLSDLMYRLASAMVVDFNQPLSAPVLKPFSATPDPPAADVSPALQPAPDPMAHPGREPAATGRRKGRRRPAAPAPANEARAPTPSESTQSKAFELVSWAAMARAWKKAVDNNDEKQAAGLLVSGNALTRIKGFAEDDRNIDAFVRASEKAEMRQRRFRRYRIGALFAVGVVAAFGANWATSTYYINDERKKQAEANIKRTNAYMDAARSLNDGNTGMLVNLLKESISQDLWGALDRLTVASDDSKTEAGDSAPLLASGEYDEIPTTESLVPPQLEAASPTVPEATASEEQRARLAALWTDDINLTCSGAMWLGDAEISRVVGVVDLATLAVGKPIVTTNWQADSPGEGSINLRAGMPDAGYKLGRFKGVVPDGATVRLDGPVEIKLNDTSPNYWAPVTVPREFCTRVDLRYADWTDRDKVSAVGRKIKEQGFIVPIAEQNPLADGLSEVRYFSKDDERFVERVRGALTEVDAEKKYNVWPLLNTNPGTQPETGAIEVWLDFS